MSGDCTRTPTRAPSTTSSFGCAGTLRTIPPGRSICKPCAGWVTGLSLRPRRNSWGWGLGILGAGNFDVRPGALRARSRLDAHQANRRAYFRVLPGAKGKAVVVFAGGPVPITVRGLARMESPRFFLVITNKAELLRRIANGEPSSTFRIYAGWTARQLQSEVTRGPRTLTTSGGARSKCQGQSAIDISLHYSYNVASCSPVQDSQGRAALNQRSNYVLARSQSANTECLGSNRSPAHFDSFHRSAGLSTGRERPRRWDGNRS